MTFEVLGDINWLAVLVGGVAYFALGGLWFSPVAFANTWQRAIGVDMSQMPAPGAAFYVVPLINSLITAVALGWLAAASESDTVGEGLLLGLVAGLGVAAAVLFNSGVFEYPKKPQPMVWFLVTGGYYVAGIVLASAIIAAWS